MSRALYSQRKAFERDCREKVRAAAKGSGWSKVRECLIRVSDGVFLHATLNPYFNAQRTFARLYAKPMNLDPQLWEILGMQSNNAQPLSLRALGAFVCSGPSFAEAEIEPPGASPSDVATAFVAFCQTEAPAVLHQFKTQRYSSLLRQRETDPARDGYAIAYVTSLICEGDLTAARRVADDYVSGRRDAAVAISVGDHSFHQLAVRWLDAKLGSQAG
jgi:hypothetical protein